jgi:ACS family hexuronate transporter-like MFS transporter
MTTVSVAPGRVRYSVCALLFCAASINYVDRQVLGVLKGSLGHELGWSETDYGNIVTAFQGAYALGMLLMGRLMDALGTRRGLLFAVLGWSLAAMSHALAGSAAAFSAARFALGLSEAGLFPGAVKTVSEWFPRKERALAIGIFNSGTNVGAILCPLAVPLIAAAWGFRAAFLLTGLLGLLWLAAWSVWYRAPGEQPRLGEAERRHIQSDAAQREPPASSSATLFRLRETWAIAGAKFLTDPVWWLYLFWIPDFLQKRHGLQLLQVGAPLVAIYLMSDVGSVLGGYVSSALMRRGVPVNRARKVTLLGAALCVLPIALAAQVSSLWVAVALVGLATAAHQAFSANLFALSSDLFPAGAVGSVVGAGGMAGAVGGMLLAQVAGRLLDVTHSYAPLFLFPPLAYLAALGLIHALSPRLLPVQLPSPLEPNTESTVTP